MRQAPRAEETHDQFVEYKAHYEATLGGAHDAHVTATDPLYFDSHKTGSATRAAFFTALSLLAAACSLLTEWCIRHLVDGRKHWLPQQMQGWLVDSEDHAVLIGSVVSAVALSGVAAGLVDSFAIQAAGSGIPEMQSILSGIWLHRFLSLRVLWIKIVALVAAIGAGLSIGREGPFVHISGIIAMQLLKHSKLFGHLYYDGAYRLEILSAACACGVAATFGAPFSGVLFSIEVHHRAQYNVAGLTRAFGSGLCVSVLTKFLPTSIFPNSNALFQTTFTSRPFARIDAFLFVVCGLLCGVGGAAFVHSVHGIARRKGGWFGLSWWRKVGATCSVACLIAVVAHFGGRTYPVFAEAQGPLIQRLFNTNSSYVSTGSVTHPSHPGSIPIGFLVVFLFYKYAITVLSVNLPVPSGCFAPTFAIGAALGRIVGVVVAEGVDASWGVASEGEFSMVCAAAFAAAVTRTVAPAVLVMELTSQANNILSVGIAVLVSYITAASLAGSIYDTHLFAGIPHMPQVPAEEQERTAEDVMEISIPTIWGDATPAEVSAILQTTRSVVFPIVEARGDYRLLGEVGFASLQHYVDCHREDEDSAEGEAHHVSPGGNLGSRHYRRATGAVLRGENQPALATFLQRMPCAQGDQDGIMRQILCVPHDARVPMVAKIFEALGPSCVYVVDRGHLVGCIWKRQLVANGWMSNMALRESLAKDNDTITEFNEHLRASTLRSPPPGPPQAGAVVDVG